MEIQSEIRTSYMYVCKNTPCKFSFTLIRTVLTDVIHCLELDNFDVL